MSATRRTPFFSRNRVPESAQAVLRESGSPLPVSEQRHFERTLGHRFDSVRVHDNETAARSADELDADAYAFGGHVVFAKERYALGSSGTRDLLTHELTHVLQQPATDGVPTGVASTEVQAERRPDAGAEPGLIHRQPRQQQPAPQQQAPQQQAPQQPAPQQTPAQQPPAQQTAAQPTLADRIKTVLSDENFDLPITVDSESTPTGQRHALLGTRRMTLDEITDFVLTKLTSGVPRPEIWSQVWQMYRAKQREHEQGRIQIQAQILYTPQYTLAQSAQPPSSMPSTPSSPWTHSTQAQVGVNIPSHPYGRPGIEHTLTVSGGFFNLGSGNLDWLQNVLGQYQISYVNTTALREQWLSLQESVFAQVGSGVGVTYSGAGADRRMNFGFMVQPGVGGQVTLNISWFQVIVQGSVAYSYLSPTTERGSTSTQALQAQAGAGIGVQF